MPFGDGTGPRWGQGRWNCRGGFGRGMGFGRGYGFGRGFGFISAYQVPREEELNELRIYADELRAELEEVKKRMAALEKK